MSMRFLFALTLPLLGPALLYGCEHHIGYPAARDAQPPPPTSETEVSADAEVSHDGAPSPLEPLSLQLQRQGGLGFCLAAGQLLSAQVSTGGSAATLVGEVFRGVKEGCSAAPVNCFETEHVERALSEAQFGELLSAVSAFTSEPCENTASPACDPCLIEKVTIDGTPYQVDGCTSFICPAHFAAAQRLTTLLDHLRTEHGQHTPAQDCYSPSRNLEQAYEDGAVGCPCDFRGQGICEKGTALICDDTDGDGAASWQAVIDGPCWGHACGEGSRIAPSREACLESNRLCHSQPDGTYCAR